MLLSNINPFIRWTNIITCSLVRDFSMAYDCRLIYIIQGSGVIGVQNNDYSLTPGMLFLFQPGTAYKLHPTDKFTAIVVDFDYTQDYAYDTDIFIPVSKDNFDKNKSHKPVVFDDVVSLNSPIVLTNIHSIKQDFELLVDEFNKPRQYCTEISSLIFKTIIFKIARHLQSANTNTQIIESILKIIHESYASQLSNKSIAERLNYNPVYLNKIFVKSYGISIHQYLIQHRLKVATKYLLTTRLSISEISQKTGFCSTDHFSHCMKQQTGHSPMYYKKQH